jgi:hypothetical protein
MRTSSYVKRDGEHQAMVRVVVRDSLAVNVLIFVMDSVTIRVNVRIAAKMDVRTLLVDLADFFVKQTV